MIDEQIIETFPFYKKKNILVCGGDGFIGSHLTNMLLKSEAEVTIVSKKKINYEIVNKRKGEDFVFFGSNQKLKKYLISNQNIV